MGLGVINTFFIFLCGLAFLREQVAFDFGLNLFMKKIPYGKHNSHSSPPSECNGCGVCMLSCPGWMQHKTQARTYCGRTRAAIGGADAQDLAPSARACILCGSCEALCPRGIGTQQSTIALRNALAQKGIFPLGQTPVKEHPSAAPGARRIFLPGEALRANHFLCTSVKKLLARDRRDIAFSNDDGKDICRALESGVNVDEDRVARFIAPLLRASEVIVSDGLLLNLLHALLPQSISVRPLGYVLLSHPGVRKGLKTDDFYMIETRSYNALRKELAPFYDSLRRETGCFMNLDLHRVATPTGASSLQHREGLDNAVSVEAQVKWILEGRDVKRIVVEHLDDQAVFSRYSSLPVVHLAEVAHD